MEDGPTVSDSNHNMNCHCPTPISTGNQVGKLQGSPWTPYAQAIADEYAIQIPLFITIPTTLTGVALQRKTTLSEPLQYDALIFGALINPGNDVDNGKGLFLQVFDTRSGVYWSAPTTINASPLTAYGGAGAQPTPVMRLPEAFFLPAGVELQHDWTQPTGNNVTGGWITWVGMQLINPFKRRAPEWAKMPNGEKIRVGSRLPWFATIGIGTRTFSAGAIDFNWVAGGSYLYYTPPTECGLEIHDLQCTTFDIADVSLTPNDQLVKIAVARSREMWTPDLTPFTGAFGDRQQVYPSLPLAKPLLLTKNERLQFRFQNNLSATAIADGMIVARGVQLCEY